MKKSDFKQKLFTVFDLNVEDLTFLEKINFIESVLVDFQKDELDTTNKGKSWTDDELKIILSDAATKQNCIKYAKLFKRSYGSIEQIYRWSTTPQKEIKQQDRENNKFIQQIKQIYKEIGLIS